MFKGLEMRGTWLWAFAVAFACALGDTPKSAPDNESRPASLARAPAWTRMPLRFEENVGQEDPQVRFAARGQGLSVFLTARGATLALGRGRDDYDAACDLRVVGALATAVPTASELTSTRTSYLRGNEPSRWQRDVQSFRRVTYPNVLAGVDQVFHGDRGAVEYDLELHPGARPESVELAFDGADSVRVGAAGELIVQIGDTRLIEPAPRALTRSSHEERAVGARFRVTGRTTVGFDVDAYDIGSTLVIDPVLAYSTYLGGTGDDYAYGIAVDDDGAMYVTGFTSSPDFPTAKPLLGVLHGSDAAFVTKISANGEDLVYSTFLGGTNATGGAYAYGIAVDQTGAAYVVGTTDSADFPTVNPYQASIAGGTDAFVAKLSPSGDALVYSTYFGGVTEESGAGIAVDATGAAYIVGTTHGGLPVKSAAQSQFAGIADAFVAKLSSSGNAVVYATYVGGSANDAGYGIAVDTGGAAYVTGYTSSLDLPTAPIEGPLQALINGSENAFVAKLTPAGSSFAYSTYLGGSVSDQGNAIAVDVSGAAYVTGLATSPDFPTKSAFQPVLHAEGGASNAFVSKLSASGMALVYSTFLGGVGSDSAAGIAIDGTGAAYVAGATSSPSFPIQNAFQTANETGPSSSTAFVAALAPSGATLLYSSYLGGSGGDSASAIAVGSSGTAYVAGYTISTDFPIVNALAATLMSAGGDNAFVAAVGPMLLGDAGAQRPDAGSPGEGGLPPSGGGDAGEPSEVDAGTGVPTVGGDGCSVTRADGRLTEPWAPLLVTVAVCVRRRRRSRLAR